MIEYIPDAKNISLSAEINGKKLAWKKPDIFTDYKTNLDVEAEVVFAGYGITAPALNYDDYKNLDVKGKFVTRV